MRSRMVISAAQGLATCVLLWLPFSGGPVSGQVAPVPGPRPFCEPAPPWPPPATPTLPDSQGATAPGTPSPSAPATTTPSAAAPDLPVAALFNPEAGAAVGGGQTSFVGYIDSAIPFSHVRLRYESAYRNNRPDRAEWFYPKCGCLAPPAPGPPRLETRVDYQDISAYVEAAYDNRFSVFVDLPVRFLNPEQNDNTAGFADMNFGFKLALLSQPDTVVSILFRTYVPTGDGRRGLGTEHVSLEPEFLIYHRLSERWFFEGELRDWIPIGGTPGWPGNVIRYGVGLSYLAWESCSVRVFPVAEFVGWTVLGGKELAVASVNPPRDQVQDADGDTIVNAKLGVRIGFGQSSDYAVLNQSDLYVGYGRALTGDVWYKDIFRVEYRLRY